MEASQILTLVLAVIGAVLGILNTWRSFTNDRVRVRVSPGFLYYAGGLRQMYIEVVNLSSFAVTITHAGFGNTDGTHGQIFSPTLLDGGNLPKRLEPRTSITVLVAMGAEDENEFALVSHAYARTACGQEIKGMSPSLTTYAAKRALARAARDADADALEERQ